MQSGANQATPWVIPDEISLNWNSLNRRRSNTFKAIWLLLSMYFQNYNKCYICTDCTSNHTEVCVNKSLRNITSVSVVPFFWLPIPVDEILRNNLRFLQCFLFGRISKLLNFITQEHTFAIETDDGIYVILCSVFSESWLLLKLVN